ncbi:AAA family ATPase [Candidatus Thiothrix anitrata]|uniref:ATP-binding protein n=1 Tax=Candidatus Thiothrix anitrata TaxID=2823902 RepID=A0ABX7WZK6_9GAMM|nr:AAA family ATPase [Candidatus Thiothrix anitrata]QTR48781.1 ATP-binding protein [Candidatus Thiothrix anitrata]
MEITLKQLGPIKRADFELGDFTIICGRNNTGKTYVTYATYGFLDYWQRSNDAGISDADEVASGFTKKLSSVFSGDKKAFENSSFSVHIGSGALTALPLFPKPFIVSAERTGAALFQREVDFTRSRIIDLLKESNINPKELLGRFTADYPLPVKHNIDFVRDLPNIIKQESLFAKQYPEILRRFDDILGGNYSVNQAGGIEYAPHHNPAVRLSLAESSSTVRSLVNIGFYLRHLAQPGDLLMVDEPELNLHPQNQRKVARLFAMLVNHGIRVFITTHSDYIIRELNTLLLLDKPDDERLRALATREGYQQGELLKPAQLSVYMTAEDPDAAGFYTLIPASVSVNNGIALSSFDDTIADMNRIQDEIIWG